MRIFWLCVALIAVLTAIGVQAVSTFTASPIAAPAPPQAFLSAPQRPELATTVLDRLLVAPGNPVGYDRDARFGSGWSDPDRNRCDTRNDILARDLLIIQRAGPCKVVSGTFDDPYTGARIPFSSRSPSKVQIDHVIPLKAAWSHGARGWPQARRVAFANDPYVLHAAEGRENQSKGDDLADGYLPPNQAYWCVYVARQVGIMDRYRLTVTPEAKREMARVLENCSGEPVPSR